MTRINTNVSSLTAQNRLQRTNNDLQSALTRLSTGLRINSGKDDPAGLIASESLRSDITSIGKALSNTQRANQIIGTADSALGQVSSLLNDVRGLVTEAANKGALSDDEIAANQLQIDSSLEAINRIAQTTTFQGRRLLDGSLDFQVQQGTGYSTVKDLQIDSANLGASGSVAVSVNISSAATKATIAADVPAASAAAKAQTTFTFNDTTIGAEASGNISFANSTVVTTETSGTATFNAKAANAEASGQLVLDGGATLTIGAKNNTSVDGTVGNNTKINVSTITTGTADATATYDATTNTLNLSLKEGATSAQVATALTAATTVNDRFSFTAGAGTIANGDAGLRTGVLTGGTDLTLAGTAFNAAKTTLTLGAGGLTLDIAANAGGVAGGTIGNSTKITYTYGTAAAAASYDATSNTVNLTIDTAATAAANVTAFNTGLSGKFTLANGTGTPAGTTTATLSNQLSGGSDAASFKLLAKNGGPADGLIGNTTTLVYTTGSGTATSAAYDATTNKLNISLGQGATIDDIANAINTTNAFSAADVKAGSARYTSVLAAPTLTGGADVTSASSFTLKAVDGGLADGVTGNTSKVKFEAATGTASTASYDVLTNQLTVKVATGATIQNVADAITAGAGSVFEITSGSIANAGAKFNSGDYATLATPLSGGTTNASGSKDDLVIKATADGVTANGVTITFQEDGVVTAGTPEASIVAGNILVKVSNAGDTKLADIASAINGLSGGLYSASLSVGSNGDGVYKGALETAPALRTLAGGILGGGLAADVTFQLTGGNGSEVFKFQKGASTTNIIQSINLLKDSTGIEAAFNSTSNKLELTSTLYGSAGVVGVEIISEGSGGTFGTAINAGGGPRAVGTDIQATVNGTVATGKGNRISLNTSTLSLNFTVADGSSTTVNFNINGGGAQFQLGPDVVSNQQARLGISSLNTAKIGGVSGKLFELASSGSSSLTKDVNRAGEIVDQVISKVTTLRGRLGAFQRTALDSNVASLNDTLANLNEAQSSIRDADFAKESANLTRAQILVQSGTSVLGIANQSSQNVLSLLR